MRISFKNYMDFQCSCQERIAYSASYVGEWNDYLIFRELFQSVYTTLAIFHNSISFSVHCPLCKEHLGYYLIETPIELKELQCKFALAVEKSYRKESIFKSICMVKAEAMRIREKCLEIERSMRRNECELIEKMKKIDEFVTLQTKYGKK